MLGAIQRIVSAVIREQIVTLAPPRTAPSDVGVPKEEAEEGAPVHTPPMAGRQGAPPFIPQEVPPQ
ncbi:UNVERIFIED_CONTAM: hypothetical protein Slati_1327100 [Sesamum latifolium]|uniref:Uncharacterized protein n=1 Tax=Sesamum latifolium TaxID=2727402 RepID=A0AAW2XH48_9LAMI